MKSLWEYIKKIYGCTLYYIWYVILLFTFFYTLKFEFDTITLQRTNDSGCLHGDAFVLFDFTYLILFWVLLIFLRDRKETAKLFMINIDWFWLVVWNWQHIFLTVFTTSAHNLRWRERSWSRIILILTLWTEDTDS